MSYLPAKYNLKVYQGDTTTFEVTYKEGVSGAETGVSLTGATVSGQIRNLANDSTVVASFTITKDADQVTNPGLFTVTLPAATSATLGAPSYIYDIQVIWADTTVQTLLYGNVSVVPQVTR